MMNAIVTRLGAWGAQRKRAALLHSKTSVDKAIQAALEHETPERLQACLRDYSKIIECASAMEFGDIWCAAKLAELNTNYELGCNFADVQALNLCIEGVSSIIDVAKTRLNRDEVAALLRTKGHALAELGHLTGRRDAFNHAITSYEASLQGQEIGEPSTLVQLTLRNIELCQAQLAPAYAARAGAGETLSTLGA